MTVVNSTFGDENGTKREYVARGFSSRLLLITQNKLFERKALIVLPWRECTFLGDRRED